MTSLIALDKFITFLGTFKTQQKVQDNFQLKLSFTHSIIKILNHTFRVMLVSADPSYRFFNPMQKDCKQVTDFITRLDKVKSMQLNMAGESISITILDKIINATNQKIEQIALLEHIPQYLQLTICIELENNLGALEPNHTISPFTMKQEAISEIPLLSMDSLASKEIGKQTVLNQTISDIGALSPKLNIQKKRPSAMGSIQESQGMSQNRMLSAASSIRKKARKSQLISISIQPEEDSKQTKSIRWKKESSIQEELRKGNLIREREQERQERLDEFASEYQRKSYTFDFEGEVVDADSKVQGKISYLALNSKIGGARKKMRQDLRATDQVSRSVNIRKSFKKQQNPDRISAADQIPLPERQVHRLSMFGPPSELSKYKLQEYRKYYGGKFHRLDRSLMNTIDVVNNEEDPHESLFNSRRDIKETNPNSKTINTSRDHGIARKIALPKLNGVYKVLDRYQEY